MSWGDDGLLWNAVTEAVDPIAHAETQLERNKLEKRIRDYFSKAAKGLEFHTKAFPAIVNDYTDKVFGSLYCGLGDREWLSEADFVLVVDAAVKDYFPARTFAGVPQHIFEQTVLQASDRASDEQRYYAYRWETIMKVVQGKNSQKKVREAADAGRVEAVQSRPPVRDDAKLEDFVAKWIHGTIGELARVTQGDVENALPLEVAIRLFHTLIQDGGLPLPLVTETGVPPQEWPFIDMAVQQAYSMHGVAVEGAPMGDFQYGGPAGGKGMGGKGKGWAEEPPTKRMKGSW